MKYIDQGLNKHMRAARNLDGADVTVGLHGDERYPDGKSVAQVAIWNEYGVPAYLPGDVGPWHIPPRPFMQTAVSRYRRETAKKMEREARQTLSGKQSAHAAMVDLGQFFRDAIQDTILTGPWAPNAPSTIFKKGHDLPLVDTERMFDSVDYEVDV